MTALVVDPKKRTAILLAALAIAMVGLGFAAVPLYRLFCNVTGFNGTTMRATEASVPGAIAGRTMVIRFDANHTHNLPWDFTPELPTQTVKIGARNIAFFTATNRSDKVITGSASYNVTPQQSAPYFFKIQCFCFTQQTLRPGQTVRMPVIFYVDPKILADPNTNDVEEITLSYTFSPVDAGEKAS